MLKKPIRFCFVLFAILLLTGCTGAAKPVSKDVTVAPASTATQVLSQTIKEINCAFDTASPATVLSEEMNISGTAPANQKFSLDSTTILRVYWTQSTKDNFDLSLVNLDPSLENSIERTITLEAYIGASSGCVDTNLNAGNYQVVVGKVDGPWKVWVEKIKYK